jgi:NAD(P)-dependent dehydrogenase (short-subunit alcohol dehydrogenase family)
MDFTNKVVLITGASSGIGRACAVAFAQRGAKLLLSDVNAEGGAETIHHLKALNADAEYMTCDVTRANEVEAIVNRAVERFGGLHVAVNSAGISGGGMRYPILEWSDDVYEQIMAVNVKGIWLCLKSQIPALMQSGGGSIINLASVAGLIGAPGGAAYSASKHAVIGLTRSVALEYARHKVRVNAVCPAFIDTPMVTDVIKDDPRMEERTVKGNPMRRLGTPEEVAHTIMFLADDGASFITGGVYAVDGGLTAM